MASDLEKVCEDLLASLKDASSISSIAHTSARALDSMAMEVDHVARASEQAVPSSVLQQLQSAASDCRAIASHLEAAESTAQEFVRRAVGGAYGSGDSGSPASDHRIEQDQDEPGSRYISSSSEQKAVFAALVAEFGTNSPEDWIHAGNPNFATGRREWTNNCGPCSRSFADAFQGLNIEAAKGDLSIPPGEGPEMWDQIGLSPPGGFSNVDATDPTTFTNHAYERLAKSVEALPPGTVVIVGVDWDGPVVPRNTLGGHWFNAYVDTKGELRWADQQSGNTGGWPPDYATPIWRLDAAYRIDRTKDWQEVKL